MKVTTTTRGWKMDEDHGRTNRMTRAFRLFFVPFVFFVVHPAFADDGWSLTTADFKRQNVNLRSFDESGAKVTA